MKLEEQEKLLERMREIAKDSPNSISIIETSVEPSIQIEFFELLQKAGADNIEEDIDIDKLYQELISEETGIDRKKNILVNLTALGEVESYRLLEKYMDVADDDMVTWSFLACQQGRMFLESKLLEESKIYIASGLGGKEYRLRYDIVIFANKDSYSESQKNIVTGEVNYFFKKEDSIVENIKFIEKYAICTVLVPVYVDIVKLINNIIKEINEYGNFAKENVFITNEKSINIEELDSLSRGTM